MQSVDAMSGGTATCRRQRRRIVAAITVRADRRRAIYDACDAGEGSPAELRQYLAEGGRVLMLADNFCNSSAQLMNAAPPNIGVSFSTEDPTEPELFSVPPDARTGLLEGVETLNIYRVVPQLIRHSFTPVVESPNGILMARREGPAARLR